MDGHGTARLIEMQGRRIIAHSLALPLRWIKRAPVVAGGAWACLR